MADTIYKTPIELGYAKDGDNYEGAVNFRYNGNSTDTITSTIQETSSGVLSLTKGELELNDRTRINYGNIYTIENICAYNSNLSAVTGTIKIKLPFGFVSIMFYAEIDIYLYNAQSASKIILGGYNFAGQSSWHNTSLTILGPYSNGVRLAHDGTYNCILLGNTTTSWPYPKVVLNKFMAGYSGYTNVYNNGYEISLITSETGYSSIVTLTSKIYN